VSPNKTSFPR